MRWNHMTLATLLGLAGTLSSAAEENRSGVPTPPVPTFTTGDADAYGRELAFYMDRYDQGWVDDIMQGTMTLFDADGDSVRRSFMRMTREDAANGDKLIVKFLSPAEIKGVAALTHENPGSSDSNWLYLPANKRVRRISGANNTASFQGTEFTYEDLANLDPSEYEWRFLEEVEITRGDKTIPTYKLAARPTYKDTGYSRLVVYIHRTEWRQERIEYYDKAGRHLKIRDSSDWRHFHGRFWRANTIEIANLQTKKRTLLKQRKQYLNLSLYTSARTGKKRSNLPEELFTRRALQK